jgi:hypothetical protein
MAESKAVFTTSDVWDDGKKIHAVGRLTLTAGPDTYTTGGVAFNVLANTVDGAGLGLPLPVVNSQPLWANAVGGSYFGQYLPATGKIKISAVVGGAEVAAGAVPAGLSSDNITAYFIFDKF